MKIAVFGAGSIGVYVGGSLLAAGGEVVLVGRARMRERIARDGLLLTDLHGGRDTLTGAQVPFSEDPAALASADLILVTVKSADTESAAHTIAAHAKPSAVVLSLQNGIGNAEVLRRVLPGHTVLGGMVPFNVVQMEGGRFHRGTGGELTIEAAESMAAWRDVFRMARMPLSERTDFLSVQWGKLLLNLNNAVNALSDLPLKAELSQRGYRRCFALLMEEALRALAAAGIKPAQLTRVAPHTLPKLMRLPDFLFRRIAATMLRIDPEARSSMWEDLKAGRRTEIDYLNGAVVTLAQSVGIDAPANRRIIELIRRVEAGDPAGMAGRDLYAALKASPRSTPLPQRSSGRP
jgi:2-dehydropantoate 2-reductase